MNGKQIIKKLESEGWQLKRVSGSHHIMGKDGKIVPIPVHGSTDLGKGLIAKIEKQTGVKMK
ncbi:MAG: type II toxin-antitoxin system HicA family toxin [Nitrosomonas sp.]|nr:type II toxin-antitoxin system HicA family toxin [Nitrosomonas sp.]